MMKNKKGVNALYYKIRGRILNSAVNGWAMDERLRINGWAMETLLPKMFRFTVFQSPGLQPWVK